MLKSAAIRSIGVIVLCTFILAIPFVMADETTESFSIYTDKEEYLVGETVNIYAKADAIDPNETITVEDVIVFDPANVSVAEWHNLSIVFTDTATPAYVGTVIAESDGNYTVSAEATGCSWRLRARWRFRCRCWCHHVIPEVPFGTVVAMLAFLGATGFYAVKKKHPEKTEN
jgi:hypothetical protein